MKMKDISETVMMCMVVIATIQFIIILAIIRFGVKKNYQGEPENKRNLIDLLNSSPHNSQTSTKECCQFN